MYISRCFEENLEFFCVRGRSYMTSDDFGPFLGEDSFLLLVSISNRRFNWVKPSNLWVKPSNSFLKNSSFLLIASNLNSRLGKNYSFLLVFLFLIEFQFRKSSPLSLGEDSFLLIVSISNGRFDWVKPSNLPVKPSNSLPLKITLSF